MAIAFDAASTGVNGTGTTITVAHTCTGTDRVLFVAASGGSTVDGATYNGVAMTAISGSGTAVVLFGLLAPASGTNNIVVTLSASNNKAVAGASYTGVNQSTGWENLSASTTGGASPTVNVTSAVGNLVVGASAFVDNAAALSHTPGTGVTERADATNGSDGVCAALGEATGAASVTFAMTRVGGGAFYSQRLAAVSVLSAGASAVVTGTITTPPIHRYTIAEDGGKTFIITLTGDTFVAAGATFDAARQAIIDGIDAGNATANGWDEVVKAGLAVTAVVRTSATVCTVTLPAFATYAPAATQTITVTVPASAVVLAAPIVATPTITTYRGPLASVTSGTANASGVLTFTVTNDDPNTANGEYTETVATVGLITARTSNRFA